MQTKDIDLPSDPTLAKLLEVDSDLAAQESHILSELQEIQQKRNSLQTVVGLFTPEETLVSPASQPVEPLLSVESATEEMDPLPEDTATSALSTEDEIQQTTQPPTTRRARATGRRTRGKTRVASGSGRGESWRPYVRDEFPASAVLPELVATVLQRSPGQVFEVPEIMRAIFIEDISKEAYKVARGRLLSVLSLGVKQNKWQRGEKGQYNSSAG